MTREHKLALVVGFGLILFVGILITDHLAADNRLHEPLPAARIPDAGDISLLGRDTTVLEPAFPNRREVATAPGVAEIVLEPKDLTPATPARPMRSVEPGTSDPSASGTLAGRGMATPPPTTDRIHTIRRGETLSDIARSVYGNAGEWRRIANANPGVNPDRLQPGTRLTIPMSHAKMATMARPAAAREVPTSTSVARSYTVRKGDSLAGIASRELGSERRWTEIQRLNRLKNDTLLPGQKITLPGR
jgi:nucleoid-associated protein YgaU